jgi:cold shock CspA family protein
MSRETPKREYGTVKFWSNSWGYLIRDNGGEDAFVHRREVHNRADLTAGDEVSFFVSETGTKGKPEAFDVRLL